MDIIEVYSFNKGLEIIREKDHNKEKVDKILKLN